MHANIFQIGSTCNIYLNNNKYITDEKGVYSREFKCVTTSHAHMGNLPTQQLETHAYVYIFIMTTLDQRKPPYNHSNVLKCRAYETPS